MGDVVLIDTSVFCELLLVPGKHGHLADGEAETTVRMCHEHRDALLLPWATILETGNHIGQVTDGTLRRKVARRFVEFVGASFEGAAPWSPAAPLARDRLASLLRDFPEWATRGSGLGDLTIWDEYERQCRLNPHRRVWIWSLDKHLASFDRTVA